MDKELAISQHVKASTLEEVNLGTDEEPRPVSVAKEMQPEEKMAMVELLKEYKDVFMNQIKSRHQKVRRQVIIYIM